MACIACKRFYCLARGARSCWPLREWCSCSQFQATASTRTARMRSGPPREQLEKSGIMSQARKDVLGSSHRKMQTGGNQSRKAGSGHILADPCIMLSSRHMYSVIVCTASPAFCTKEQVNHSGHRVEMPPTPRLNECDWPNRSDDRAASSCSPDWAGSELTSQLSSHLLSIRYHNLPCPAWARHVASTGHVPFVHPPSPGRLVGKPTVRWAHPRQGTPEGTERGAHVSLPPS